MRESFISSLKSALIWKTLNRVSGLIKHVVIAAAIGLSSELDIFYMAMALSGVFIFTWAQMLEVMAVPTLVNLNKKGEQQAFLSMAGGLFGLSFLFSLILSIILISGRNWLSMIAWGFDAQKKAMLSNALLWFSPVFVFYIPFYYIGSVYRSVRKFKIFYQAEFIIGLFSLVLIVLFRHSPHVLLWSFSISIVIAFLFLILQFTKDFKVWSNPFTADIIRVLKIAPGLLILQGAHYIYILTDRIFISFLSSGLIGALVYGRTIAFFIEKIIGIKNSFITIFSESDNNVKKASLYNDLISLSIFVALPLTVFYLFYGENIIALFLERGMFNKSDTGFVNIALSGFAFSILPIVLQVPLEQIFQVYGRIDLMVTRKIIGLIINAFLNYVFLFGFGWGIWGIAFATSISYWFILSYSIHAAIKIGLIFELLRHIKWTSWILLVSIVSVLGVKQIALLITWKYTIILSFGVYATLLFFSGLVYRGSEGHLVKNAVKKIVNFRS